MSASGRKNQSSHLSPSGASSAPESAPASAPARSPAPRHRVTIGIGALATLLALTVVADPAWSRAGQPPPSMSRAVIPEAAVRGLEMAPVDVERLRAEDLINDQSPTPGPTRFAAQIETRYNLLNSGTWEKLADGSRLWRLRVALPGALSLNLGLRHFDLPEGAGLWLYGAGDERIEGPYTRRHRSRDGQLWTSVLLGDEIMLELHLPPGAGDARLEVGAVNHGYRFFGEVEEKQGACNIDVVCSEADPYRDQVRAVARYTRSGTSLCTGNLVNNTAGDFRPYFLTAEHCGISAGNAGSVVVYWNYESSTCGQLGGGSLADNQSGSTYRASYFPSDFALVELDQMPDSSSNVFYAGWDAGGSVPRSVVGIHHPAGDEKAIAFEGDPLLGVDLGRGGGETHWEVSAWDQGTTEPGSSGSCIFDQTSKGCVGHLTGGIASCAIPTGYDVYGKFSEAWTGGGTDATRLSNWLDPAGGGATTFLDGADPSTGGGGDCTADDTTLCLPADNRFAVSVYYETTQGGGRMGDGQTVPLGSLGVNSGGIFYFINPENPELLVKVLDGCGINNRFWVFYAATTNIGFELTVTDTAADTTVVYTNPDINPANAVTDTQAFATCP